MQAHLTSRLHRLLPNRAAPLQFLFDSPSAPATTAPGPAGAWLSSNLAALRKTGHMHEKYNARVPGEWGGGGEYSPQVGFGWSNGVVLDLLRQGYAPDHAAGGY